MLESSVSCSDGCRLPFDITQLLISQSTLRCPSFLSVNRTSVEAYVSYRYKQAGRRIASHAASIKRPPVYGAPPQQRSDDSNDTLSYIANFTPPMRASLSYYMLHAAK